MTPEEMLKEAKRLDDLQVKERGEKTVEFGGKKLKVRGPYVSSPEREERAARIVDLRRQASRALHPLRRPKEAAGG